MSPGGSGPLGRALRGPARGAPLVQAFLRELRRPEVTVLDARRIALVAAHPDDETVGLGAQLPRLAGLRIVHITDGAPADMRDAREHGFASREDYAAARREELETAMAVAGIPPVRLVGLGVADQEASLVMTGLARRLADLFDAQGVALAITHPYEGGHPDHDAACFAVHAAARLLARQGRPAPAVLEMASYHAGPDGNLVTNRFLWRPDCPEVELPLDEEARILKRRLLECHHTQQAVLAQFHLDCERLRPAPAYDFLSPPHEGPPWYENFRWGGLDGAGWRALAAGAIGALELEAPPWR